MNLEEFRTMVRHEVADVEGADKWTAPPATDAEVAHAEAKLGARLPADYVAFIKEFGGGTVGFNGRREDIYSVRMGHWSYIVRHQPPRDLIQNFVAVSENGCGDYYGFAVVDGVCQPRLLFSDHEIEYQLEPARWPNFLSFLAKIERCT